MPYPNKILGLEQSFSSLKYIKHNTKNEKIKILYNHLTVSVISSFACSSAIFFILYNPLTIFEQSWYAAVIAISTFRLFLIFFRKLTPLQTNLHLILFILGTALSASTWGVVSLFLMPENNFLQQMVIIIIISGVSSGAMQTLQANLISVILFLTLSILPLCFWLFAQPAIEYNVLGASIITYLIFCGISAYRGNRLITQVLTLNFKNLNLASQLSESNEELINKNSQLERHEQDMIIINQMNEKLQLCKNSIEAHLVIKIAAEQLFFDFFGGLTITDTSGSQILVSQWGDRQTLKTQFSSDICWGIRSGNKYIIEDHQINLFCNHYIFQPEKSCCIPLIVETKTLGMINFNFSEKVTITNYNMQVMTVFGDAVKLALTNIQLREKLQSEATRDPLTNLFNRRYLNETLSREIHRIIREKNALCFAMLDLDHFKKLNDTYGHEAGDETLKYIANLLMNLVRESDIVCRFGGEEFSLIFINTTLDKILPLLEHIRQEIEHAKIYFQNELLHPITASIGVAQAPEQGETVHDIIRAADIALYSAKHAGRNRVMAASPFANNPLKDPPESKDSSAPQRPLLD